MTLNRQEVRHIRLCSLLYQVAKIGEKNLKAVDKLRLGATVVGVQEIMAVIKVTGSLRVDTPTVHT